MTQLSILKTLKYPYLWNWGTGEKKMVHKNGSLIAGYERPVIGQYKGKPCRVLVRGKQNSCLVEFEDGQRFVTSRNGVRRR